jgi:hypothetical protein
MWRKFFRSRSRPTVLQGEIDRIIDHLVALRSAPICQQETALVEEDPTQLRELSRLARAAANVFDHFFQEVAVEGGLAFQSDVVRYSNAVRAAVDNTVVRDIQARAKVIEASALAA